MNWIPVDSTRVSAAAWENNTTYLKFPNGVIYAYSNVSLNEHNQLINAPSVGKALIHFEKLHPYKPV